MPAAGTSALPPAVVEVAADDDEYGWDALREWCLLPGCELLAFDTTFDCADNRLDADEEGGTISTVTAGAGRRRVHALVDGKRPDAAGRVPPSGPY